MDDIEWCEHRIEELESKMELLERFLVARDRLRKGGCPVLEVISFVNELELDKSWRDNPENMGG